AAIAYAEMAGAEASLMRAVFMGILIALGLSFWREPDLLNMLGFAGLGMLAINPLVTRDLGFVLSMAAVWGVAGPGRLLYQMMAASVGPWATLSIHTFSPWARAP